MKHANPDHIRSNTDLLLRSVHNVIFWFGGTCIGLGVMGGFWSNFT